MPKIPGCDRCRFCAHDYNIVCTVHPAGPNGDTCPNFEKDPELPELEGRCFVDSLGLTHVEADEWKSQVASSFYRGKLSLIASLLGTPEQQLELVDNHLDCIDCWMDDSV